MSAAGEVSAGGVSAEYEAAGECLLLGEYLLEECLLGRKLLEECMVPTIGIFLPNKENWLLLCCNI